MVVAYFIDHYRDNNGDYYPGTISRYFSRGNISSLLMLRKCH